MSDFEKLKEQLPSKEKFYSSLVGETLVIEKINMFLMFGANLDGIQSKSIMFIFKM